MIVPVRLRFPFELQFIPKKGRNDRTGSFYGDGYGMVRRAGNAVLSACSRRTGLSRDDPARVKLSKISRLAATAMTGESRKAV